jgi:hypothetical protein
MVDQGLAFCGTRVRGMVNCPWRDPNVTCLCSPEERKKMAGNRVP